MTRKELTEDVCGAANALQRWLVSQGLSDPEALAIMAAVSANIFAHGDAAARATMPGWFAAISDTTQKIVRSRQANG